MCLRNETFSSTIHLPLLITQFITPRCRVAFIDDKLCQHKLIIYPLEQLGMNLYNKNKTYFIKLLNLGHTESTRPVPVAAKSEA
jgi:hypothetical protein